MHLNPTQCGLLVLRYDMIIQELQLKLINDSKATMGVAHLYNACMASGNLMKAEQWPDMEALIELCKEERVYIGSRPTDPITFHNRFILAAGISVRAFAYNKRGSCNHITKLKKCHWEGSEQRR